MGLSNLLDFVATRVRDVLWTVTAMLGVVFVIDKLDNYRESTAIPTWLTKTKVAAEKAGKKRIHVSADVQEVLTSAQCLRRAWSGLPGCVCDQAGPLIDIILRDFIHKWFRNASDSADFGNGVQDILVFSVGELLMRARQYLNPVEFALHKGTLLLRHHVSSRIISLYRLLTT